MRHLLLATALSLSPTPALAADAGLATHAERTGWRETGRYEEVIALCDAFQRAYPKTVRCFDFGTSPQGRPMKAMAISGGGHLTAEQARASGLPVLLAQGGIHAGEIDGKDAGFGLVRDLLEGKVGKGLLDRQVLLFVPVFNVDGHENFRAWNRPNQRGPEQMGFRTTAQRYNLNRDYLKADSPEMQAMLALVQAWDPLAMLDLHVTDGAQFQHDISITGEPVSAGDEALQVAGRALKDGIIAKLARRGSMPVGFYPSFRVEDDPSSGFSTGVSPPRFSHGYFQLRNRLAILVETHSWRTYPERVRATYNTVLGAMELVAEHGNAWLRLARDADGRAARLGGQAYVVDYATTEASRPIAFEGYAYTRTPSEVSGATMTRYDERTPQRWTVPLFDTIVPRTVITAPKGGYIVPPEHADAVARQLEIHGVGYRRLDNARSKVEAQAFQADSVQFATTSVEGHQRATIAGNWQPARVDVLPGALFVPIAQPKARLLMQVLEPQAGDSMAAWGRFNNAFERKEYMEPYVAEEQARLMLARDPTVKAAFEKALAEDPAFAADPSALLDFFYRRHTAWDGGYNRYPVLRTDLPVD